MPPIIYVQCVPSTEVPEPVCDAALDYFIRYWSGKPFEEEIATKEMRNPKFWVFFASKFSPQERERVVEETMERALRQEGGQEVEPFPLEEQWHQWLRNYDYDFRTLYARVAEGHQFEFLRTWFCTELNGNGGGEAMSVGEEARMESEDAESEDAESVDAERGIPEIEIPEIQRLMGQEGTESQPNREQFLAEEYAWEWTEDDSEAEEEHVWEGDIHNFEEKREEAM